MENAFIKTAYIKIRNHIIKLDSIVDIFYDEVSKQMNLSLGVSGAMTSNVIIINAEKEYNKLIEILPIREL